MIDDARSFLRASPQRFDVIVGDLFVPWQLGSGSLFSREHFTNARARLAAGGVFCQWLPLYQLTKGEFLTIARSFADVFPAADLFRGDFFGTHPIASLCGAAESATSGPRRRARSLPSSDDRWIANPLGPAALYIGPLDVDRMAANPVESDARPVLEFAAARSHAGGSVFDPFVGLAWLEFSRRSSAAGGASGGLALQTANALFSAERTGEASAAFAEAERLLPKELVRDAPPDPSASELWHTRSD